MRLRLISESIKVGHAASKFPPSKLYEYGAAANLGPNITKSDPDIIRLAKDIAAKGYLSPLRLCIERWQKGNVPEFPPTDPENARAYLCDGKHRLCASEYLRYTHVPVYADGQKIPARFQGIPV